MSFDMLSDLNWLAVIVATLAYWILGAVWYAPPVLGRAWQAASGTVVPEGQRPSTNLLVGTFVANLLTVVATAMLAASTGSSDVGDALVLGVVLGVGFGFAFMLVGALAETRPKPVAWFTINAGYHLIGLIGVSLIVTLWD